MCAKPCIERGAGHRHHQLNELGDQAPALVRGDCGYGHEDIIDVCEQRGCPYLLRLRKTANVKRLIQRLFSRQDWTHANQGRQTVEDELRLSGWRQARRVVVLRRLIKHDEALAAQRGAKARFDEQLVLALPFDAVQDNTQLWKYPMLVTNARNDLAAIGQLYRDRCDCCQATRQTRRAPDGRRLVPRCGMRLCRRERA